MNVTATVRTDDNPEIDSEWPGDGFHYIVTLRYQRRQMTVKFHTGSGWTRQPNVRDVLECLLSDAGTVDNARGFEDWADDLGYDPDSRKAERIYRECVRQTKRLARLLGDDYDDALFSDDQEGKLTELTGIKEG